MRTKAEQLLSRQLQVQPRLEKLLVIQTDLWTDEVIANLQARGYVTMSYVETGRCCVPLMLITERARQILSHEEQTNEKTSTYLSTDWSSGVTSRGGGTIQQDCDTCGGSVDERDEAPKTPSR